LRIRCVPAGTPLPPETLASFRFDGGPTSALLTAVHAPWTELWQSGAAVRRRGEQGFAIHETVDFSFLVFESADAEDIEALAFDVYTKLRTLLAGSRHPHPLRIWNYFDRLNEGTGDAERYRRFCLGRYRAIAEPGFETRLPAATVIGRDAPGFWLGCLAARAPGIGVENPRQTSAYRYPREYGPVSPSFSRARLVGRSLIVSGTASVVGDATRHPHDAAAQMEEIAANIEALLDQAARIHLAGTGGEWRADAIRLYVREARFADAACERLRCRLALPVPPNVLRGDISRSDLMAEVEGVWTLCDP
jgi:chorismate lyase/3-hydroxybenzoate synthase